MSYYSENKTQIILFDTLDLLNLSKIFLTTFKKRDYFKSFKKIYILI